MSSAYNPYYKRWITIRRNCCEKWKEQDGFTAWMTGKEHKGLYLSSPSGKPHSPTTSYFLPKDLAAFLQRSRKTPKSSTPGIRKEGETYVVLALRASDKDRKHQNLAKAQNVIKRLHKATKLKFITKYPEFQDIIEDYG